jgi:hypothetical protein
MPRNQREDQRSIFAGQNGSRLFCGRLLEDSFTRSGKNPALGSSQAADAAA